MEIRSASRSKEITNAHMIHIKGDDENFVLQQIFEKIDLLSHNGIYSFDFVLTYKNPNKIISELHMLGYYVFHHNDHKCLNPSCNVATVTMTIDWSCKEPAKFQ